MSSIIDIYRNLFGRKGINDGSVIDMSEHGRVGGISTGQPFKFVSDTGALGLLPYDYCARVLTNATTETYTFKSGGASGTVTNTVVIVYTDSTLETISTVTKT